MGLSVSVAVIDLRRNCTCVILLRKLKTLPPSCIFIAASNKFHWVFGFGVDDVSGDYKVVRIFYHALNLEALPLVEVYSLRTNSWKSIELNIPVPRVLNLYFSSVLCNGVIHWFTDGHHWFADGHPDKPIVILCFDLSDEVFRVMELPDALSVMKRGYVFLFGGSLSVFLETANENPDEGLRYEVWVMREYGVVESWKKEFIGLVEGVCDGEVGFTRGGKVILRKSDGMLALLDLECGLLEDVGFNEKSYRVADYVESLVLLEDKQLEDVADIVDLESPALLEDGVSSRVRPELRSRQGDGGASCSSSAVEDDDAKWIADIHSAANEIPPNIWRAWGTS